MNLFNFTRSSAAGGSKNGGGPAPLVLAQLHVNTVVCNCLLTRRGGERAEYMPLAYDINKAANTNRILPVVTTEQLEAAKLQIEKDGWVEERRSRALTLPPTPISLFKFNKLFVAHCAQTEDSRCSTPPRPKLGSMSPVILDLSFFNIFTQDIKAVERSGSNMIALKHTSIQR